MLSNSVIILVREVLEAALLIAVLLSMSQLWPRVRQGVAAGVVLGGALAWLYAHQLYTVAEWFDGVGQEVMDAAAQWLIALLLPVCCVLFIRHYQRPERVSTSMVWLLCGVIALAISREGAEVYIYVSAFAMQPEQSQALIVGAVLGVGIGFSVGALIYYFLLGLSDATRLKVGGAMLTVIAAGLALQACKMLIQADWLPDGEVWDSSDLLSEHSVMGQLMYALAGYEATPAPVQVWAYGLVLLASVSLQIVAWARHKRANRRSDSAV